MLHLHNSPVHPDSVCGCLISTYSVPSATQIYMKGENGEHCHLPLGSFDLVRTQDLPTQNGEIG